MATADEMAAMVEDALRELLAGSRPAVLHDAMRHAVLCGGKRVRPLLCLASSMAVGGSIKDALFPACAIELLHSYTLVHDDLPSMDNDTMRRGQPSVWAKFGEANAILAGDALQALAFSAAARAPRNAGKVVSALGDAAVGVVRGQVEDISDDRGDIDFIYRHKTADLFVAAAAMGAYAGGGSDTDAERLRTYALNLGLAFQFEDDLLDGDSPYAKAETERKIADMTKSAIAALDGLPGDTGFLSSLAARLVGRTA